MKAILISSLILLVLASILVVQAPAHLVSRFVNAHPTISIVHAQGTLWSGEAVVYWEQRNLGRMSWNLSFLQLLIGQIEVDMMLNGSAMDLELAVERNRDTLRLSGYGTASPELIDSVLIAYDIDLAGLFEFQNIEFSRVSEPDAIQLSGMIDWSGGEVRYRLAGVAHKARLPALQGRLDSPDNVIRLTVYLHETDDRLFDVNWDLSTGWFELNAMNRFLQVVDVPWDVNDDGDAKAFQLSEQFNLTMQG